VLGAGLDMRAFRLAWPGGTRLFELDTPDVLAFKEKVTAEQSWSARCERVAVRIDLREDWPAALRAAGFRPAEPAAWLAEGLLRYLGADQSVRLLIEITAFSAAGSWLGMEQGDLATLRSPAMLSALGELDPSAAEDQRALWSGSDRKPDHQPWLATHGWQTRSQDVYELARAYGRPVPPAFRASFVTAQRQPGQPQQEEVNVSLVALRPVEDSDLDALFDQMRDPESVRMAAFTAEDPGDRRAFDAHMAKIRSRPDVTLRAVTCGGQLVGSISSFVAEGQTEVTYWIDRAAWGRGIASQALALLLELVPARPVHARAASDNAGSLRVLQKAGFKAIGTENSFAPGRNAQIEETILRKD
jgi:RimJ/RimL family protein N-acetyltransferase